jgi:hypothetical protein
MLGGKNLTETITDEQRRTVPGMAFWAGTGPAGTVCGYCRFWGYKRTVLNRAGYPEKTFDKRGRQLEKTINSRGCKRFYELTKTHGPGIDKFSPSCKYFEQY